MGILVRFYNNYYTLLHFSLCVVIVIMWLQTSNHYLTDHHSSRLNSQFNLAIPVLLYLYIQEQSS